MNVEPVTDDTEMAEPKVPPHICSPAPVVVTFCHCCLPVVLASDKRTQTLLLALSLSSPPDHCHWLSLCPNWFSTQDCACTLYTDAACLAGICKLHWSHEPVKIHTLKCILHTINSGFAVNLNKAISVCPSPPNDLTWVVVIVLQASA